MKTRLARTAQEVRSVAQALLQTTPRCLALTGPLGAGKTTLAQALGSILGVRETITSPTFGLQHIYAAKHPHYDTLVHIDCYRLRNVEAELPALDVAHWLERPRTLVVIEWADRIQKFIPSDAVEWVDIRVQANGSRRFAAS